MPTIGKKPLARWPVVLADYEDALAGKIKPIPREIFLDFQGKDALFYHPAGYYVSIVNLIRAGVMKVWLPPCVSYDAILINNPAPDLGSVCIAIDTGIMYEYRGNGKWIPISINAIKYASEDDDGIITSWNYKQLQDCYNRLKIVIIGETEVAPIPRFREKNTLYEITTNVIAEPHEKDWETLVPVDEKVIKENWKYVQLWDTDLETGQVYEIVDPLYLFVKNEQEIVPVEVPEGYSDVRYMWDPKRQREDLVKIDTIVDAYPEGWPYEQFFETNESGELYMIRDPGYLLVPNDDMVKPVTPECGVTAVFYVIPKTSDTIKDWQNSNGKTRIIETVDEVGTDGYTYDPSWPYDRVFDTDSNGVTYTIKNPGYITVKSDADVYHVDPIEGVDYVYFRVPRTAEDIKNEDGGD